MEASARAPEDLYGLPLEEFTPARDALAKALKGAGRRDEAAEVRSLRKPTLVAWALNRTARDHPDAIERLRAAGADLRAAQEEALSGDAGRLRDAGRSLSDEIDRVAGLAVDALRSANRPAPAAQREKLAGTLRTAAVDDEAGEILARGVLVDDLDPTGFSLLAALPGETSPSGPSSGAALPGSEPKPKRTSPAREAMEAVEAARRELRRRDAEADQATGRARRQAERAEAAAKRAAEAQREADEARSVAEEAAAEAEAARRRAHQAAAALAAAEAALDA